MAPVKPAAKSVESAVIKATATVSCMASISCL